MKYIFLLIFIFALLTIKSYSYSSYKNLSILIKQIENHPKQTLQDVYKSCYQDEYGPGHLIPNETTAINSLLQEINSIEEDYNPITLFEETGLNGNYLRVDLTLIQKEVVPFFVLFRALIISANIGSQKTDDDWSNIWTEIVDEIRNSTLTFENFEEDVVRLDEISKSKDKVVHHSELYENTYHPHYRIIEKSVFEKYIKPFIKN